MGAYYDELRAAYIEDTQNDTDKITDQGGQTESEPARGESQTETISDQATDQGGQTESGTVAQEAGRDAGQVRQDGSDSAGVRLKSETEFKERAANVQVETKKRKKIDQIDEVIAWFEAIPIRGSAKTSDGRIVSIPSGEGPA